MTSGSELEWDGPVLLSMVDGYFSRVMAFVYGEDTVTADSRPWTALILDGMGYLRTHTTTVTEHEARRWVELMAHDGIKPVPRVDPVTKPKTRRDRHGTFVHTTKNTRGLCRVEGQVLTYCGAGTVGFVEVAEVRETANGTWAATVYGIQDGVEHYSNTFCYRRHAENWALDMVTVMLEHDYARKLERTRLVKGRQR